jgi:hypothetical protein
MITAVHVRHIVTVMEAIHNMLRLVLILELITILSGLFFLRKGRPGSLYFILVAIILATFNENIFIHHSKHWWNISRNIFYNAFSLIDISLWFIVFFKIFSENKLMQKVVIFGSTTILIYSLLEIFYLRSPNQLHTDSLMSWSAFVVVLCLVYFSDVLKKECHLLSRDPSFWLCAGAICFNAVFFLNLQTIGATEYWENAGTALIFDVLQCAAIFLYYLFICFAFIVHYYNYRRISRPALS